jgi:hypothetical protein
MKLTPYAKLLVMGKEALDATLAPIRARAAKKQAELELAKLDERIATLESELTSICAQKDINFERVIEKMDDIALASRRRDQFNQIIDQMFPTAEATT